MIKKINNVSKLFYLSLIFSFLLVSCSLGFNNNSNSNAYDLSGITFDDQTVVYDGQEHSLEINGVLPKGVIVNYSNNNFINAGTYRITAEFLDEYRHNSFISEMTATLTIEKAEYDMSGVTFDSKAFVYDGEKHTLEINGSDTVTVSKEDLTETQKIGKNYENSKLFNYRKGKGYITDPKNEKRELQATNIALGKLGEFTEYKKVNAFRNYVADWYFADFFVNTMRDESLDFVDATKLREDCRNLREVLLNIKQTNKDAYGKIVNNIKLCLPEIKSIGVVQKEKQTHLEIIDKNFTSPFSELSVSDGALKLLAYITLLAQKEKISFLMIEEPENQIYVESLTLLFELFDSAAFEGLQLFISTHSPDFIKNASTDNVIIVTKQDGKTQVQKLASNKMLKKYVSTVGISEAWRDGGLFSI